MTVPMTDDEVFQRAAAALDKLRTAAADHPHYGSYKAAAFAWVNSAQERLAAMQKPVLRSV